MYMVYKYILHVELKQEHKTFWCIGLVPTLIGKANPIHAAGSDGMLPWGKKALFLDALQLILVCHSEQVPLHLKLAKFLSRLLTEVELGIIDEHR